MTLRLGISACLLGERVRHNAGHKRDRFLTDIIGPDVEWVPVCPEVEIGLGVPRPRLRLGGRGEGRIVESDSGVDHSDAMDRFTKQWLAGVGNLHGMVLKRGSPSCGRNITVWEEGHAAGSMDGRFARHLSLPTIDEGRLRDPGLREHFFDQAMAWRRFEDMAADQDQHHLQAFHAANKLTLMSHDPDGARRLGRLAADGDIPAYRSALSDVLAIQATRGRHSNVLQHIQGYLQDLRRDDREELTQAIADHRDGIVPILVPLTLLRHHLRRQGGPDWILEQSYLEPYPKEWMLRHGI